MSLNDVCVYCPAWFGVPATVLLGLLTSETSGCANAGAAAALMMALIPAHLSRSMAGSFDNECIAITAMLGTFYTWCRALRDDRSWPFGAIAGLFYLYMVATWGGYVFALNLIAAHAALLIVLRRFTTKLYRAYSLFFVIGTLGAIQVPPVGWAPLRSVEQIAPLGLFLLLQVIEFSEALRRRRNMDSKE